MRRSAGSLLFCAATALFGSPVAAQLSAPDPPGPYVADLRGATAGLPAAAGFYPTLTPDANVPARGFGFDVGAHVYLVRLGPSRLGIGASLVQVRGTVPGVSSTARLLVSQLSFNFGTADGWSYLSGGIGGGRVDTEVSTQTTRSHDSGTVRSLNAGGGARWFLTSHVAVGFDVRFHRLAAGRPRGTTAGTPAATLVSTSVGISLK